MSTLSEKQKRKIEKLADGIEAANIARRLKIPEQDIVNYIDNVTRAKRRRERRFKAAMLMLPVLFFVVLELTLRGFSYGGNLALFLPSDTLPGYMRINPNVGARYFANLRVAPETSNDFFRIEKNPEAFRIFVFGGSSAYGYPYGHNSSLSKFLLQRLQAIFPEREFEVVNLAMTAINSFSILNMLNEALQQQPDAIVVYSGHNEYYGALGAGSVESLGSSRALIKLYLKLQNYRTVLFLRHQIEKLKNWIGGSSESGDGEGATLMERMVGQRTIAAYGPTYEIGASHFLSNLEEIGETAKKAGVPVYFCTLVSNHRDQAPFISLSSPEVDPQILDEEIASAKSFQQEGKYESALALYQNLIEQDSTSAHLHFESAKCLDALGQYEKAAEAYKKAVDCDALRFRAPSIFNKIIRDVAVETYNYAVDVEAAFATASAHGLLGNDLFLEHLHPKLEGYFIMGREIALSMWGAGEIESVWPSDYANMDSLLWAQRAVTPLDEEVARIRIEMLTRRWPFVTDRPLPDYEYKPENRTQELAYDLWQKKLTWEQAHVRAADYYTKKHDYSMAAKEYEALILETPQNASPYVRAGLIYIMLNDLKKAKDRLVASLALGETPEAHKSLGAILLKERKPIAAVAHLEKALEENPNDTQLLYNLTGGYLMIGEPDKADQTLAKLEGLKPRSIEVATLRSDILQLRRRQEEFIRRQSGSN
jgi:tetratricopeptide (TPR) repeat protein